MKQEYARESVEIPENDTKKVLRHELTYEVENNDIQDEYTVKFWLAAMTEDESKKIRVELDHEQKVIRLGCWFYDLKGVLSEPFSLAVSTCIVKQLSPQPMPIKFSSDGQRVR